MLATPLLLAALATSPSSAENPDPAKLERNARIVAAIGTTFFVGGSAFLVVGRLQVVNARSVPRTPEEVFREQLKGRQNTVGGASLIGVGLCAWGVSTLIHPWFGPPASSGVDVGLSLSPQSVGLVFTGRLP